MDTSVSVCESLYRNTCGKWVDEHANENRAFSYAYNKNQGRLSKLITTATTTAGGLNVFYQSCVTAKSAAHPSVVSREASLEYHHLLHVVTENFRSLADLPTALGRLAHLGYTTPFAFSIERHPTEPRMVPLFAAEGFSAAVDEQVVYLQLNAARLMAGYNVLDIQRRVQAIVRINTVLKRHNTEPIEAITNYKEYMSTKLAQDVVQFADLLAATPIWSWDDYFNALDGQALRFNHDQLVWVIGRPYMQWFLGIGEANAAQGFASFTVEEWRAWIEFSILYNSHQFEPSLPDDVYYKQHDRRGPLGPGGRFYHRIPREEIPQGSPKRTGTQSASADCVRVTQHMLPGLVARAFLDTYTGSVADRERVYADVTAIVNNVRAAFVDVVQNETPWLAAADRSKAVAKLQAIGVRVGEPPAGSWTAEPFAARLAADRFEHNMNLVRRYRVQRNLALWHKDAPTAFDRASFAYFTIPLADVNAYYSPSSNTITVLTGILQPPFYSVDYGTVSKYAILGSVVGHELAHALDSNGVYWDKEGSFLPPSPPRSGGGSGSSGNNGIFSAASMREFRARTQCLVDEYSRWKPHNCSSAAPAAVGTTPTASPAAGGYGESTLGENIADVTGIALSYKAMTSPSGGASSALSDRQYFFLVLSQAFCESWDAAHRCAHVHGDVHAVADFRMDLSAARNLPAFSEAFGCHAGQAMYKAEGTQCRVY
jgi:predicted metalloendopeptidase